ncbi:MAG: hypothetical protein ACRER2_12980 [Methylococcales bacterium]
MVPERFQNNKEFKPHSGIENARDGSLLVMAFKPLEPGLAKRTRHTNLPSKEPEAVRHRSIRCAQYGYPPIDILLDPIGVRTIFLARMHRADSPRSLSGNRLIDFGLAGLAGFPDR